MTVQFIDFPGGRMAVLPEEEYRRLVEAAEDAADAAASADLDRKLAAGEAEFIPEEIAKRLFAGENKVRVWREHRGITAKALAEQAGVSQGYLSQIEAGKREGTLETMKRIATALKLSLDDLA